MFYHDISIGLSNIIQGKTPALGQKMHDNSHHPASVKLLSETSALDHNLAIDQSSLPSPGKYLSLGQHALW